MNILHVTDFHYSTDSSLQKRVVKSIIKSINEQKLKIDLLFFTGDLVEDGSNAKNFSEARIALFDMFSEELSIPKENIIFCPGNHDIDRHNIHGAMKSFFDQKIVSEDSLNDFYKKKNEPVFLDSLKPSNNFYNFLDAYHVPDGNNIRGELYSLHFRKVNEKKLGIVCLNSAWISSIDKEKFGKEDKGNLLIPHELLEDVKRKMGKVDKRIILVHHPLYFLKDFNFYRTESFIHNEFDLLFSGHVHKIASLSRHSGSNGIFEHVAKASLSSKENLGCSFIIIDEIEENKIIVREISCIGDSDSCHIGSDVIHTIPCGLEKAEIIGFRKKLFEKIQIEKESANNLLLIKENEDKEDFLTLYNHPILKKESEGGFETKKAVSISLEEMVQCKDNYLVLGKDKCGKTSLLKRIQLECLINFSRNGKTPFYFDAREFEGKLDSDFSIELLVRNYFSINRAKVQEILSTKNFLLLIDNYSPNSAIAAYLNDFFNDHANISFIICTEYNLSRTVDFFQFGESLYEKLFFHDLRRKEIIAYTDKRLSNYQKKEEVQTKIIQLCKQLELPLNYWTISLLLLIHNKSSDSYSKNLFSILEVCVDEIFGKKQLLLSKSRISFDQLKTICAELAKELFKHHKESIYSAPYQKILSQIDKTISSNDRISANSRDVFDYLLSCSILKQKNKDDFYVFRLNGFFEYFLALQMTKDSEFKNEILHDDINYLGFKNQLEIYCGFKRDDLNFLRTVYEKSKDKITPIFKPYNESKDNELLKKIQTPEAIEDVCRKVSVQKALNSQEIAEIEDITNELQINAEVHPMKEMDPNKIDSELIERYLSILSRTFRNLDEISGNKDEITEIFNYIINCYCDFGYFIIEEFAEITKHEIDKEGEIDIENFPELALLRFISNFSPILTQSFLNDSVGHYSLERMIKDEIKKLEIESSKNQYKLFLLYFLLLDIDLSSNREYIQIALEKIKMPVLKYAIFIKLNYYLAFKSTSNKLLQKELSKHIQQAQLNIDNKASLSDIQRQIQVKKKMSLINKAKPK
jgi:predicted phosphodiesterase